MKIVIKANAPTPKKTTAMLSFIRFPAITMNISVIKNKMIDPIRITSNIKDESIILQNRLKSKFNNRKDEDAYENYIFRSN